MVERDFADTVDTTEDDGIVESAIGGRFCVATGRVTLGGRQGNNSEGGVHGMGRRNDVVHRPIGLMVAGGNTSWERMSRSEMTVVTRAGFYCWRRESAIRVM